MFGGGGGGGGNDCNTSCTQVWSHCQSSIHNYNPATSLTVLNR